MAASIHHFFQCNLPPPFPPSLPPLFLSYQHMAGPNIILTDFPGTSNGDISNGCKGEAAGGKKQDVIIIKLGGSSITDKTGFEVGREEGRKEGREVYKGGGGG